MKGMHSLLSPQRACLRILIKVRFPPLSFGHRFIQLHLASIGRHTELARLLVEHGVDVKHQDYDKLLRSVSR
jgi:hypothetical protein